MGHLTCQIRCASAEPVIPLLERSGFVVEVTAFPGGQRLLCKRDHKCFTLEVLDAGPIIRHAKEQNKKWIAHPRESPGFMRADVRLGFSDQVDDVLEILNNAGLLVENTAVEISTCFDVGRSSLVIKLGALQPRIVGSLCRALWNEGFVRPECCKSGHIRVVTDPENDEEYKFSETHWLSQDEFSDFLESHSDVYWINLGPFHFGERLTELREFGRLGLEIRRQEGVSLFFPGSYLSHRGLQVFVGTHGLLLLELLQVVHEITGTDAAIFSAIGHELTPIVLPRNGGPTAPTR